MKLRYFLTSIVACLALAIGCNKVELPALSEISVTPSYFTFTVDGGAKELTVNAVADWTVTDVPEWLTVTPMKGTATGAEGVKVTVTAQATQAEEIVTATIKFNCAGKTQLVTVGQEAYVPDYPKFQAGEYWIMFGEEVAVPVTSAHGYLYTTAANKSDDGKLSSTSENIFTFTAVEGGFSIQDAAGKYYAMKGTYTSFNLYDTPQESYVYTVQQTGDNKFLITNVNTKVMQYDPAYGSAGAYSPAKPEAIYPNLVSVAGAEIAEILFAVEPTEVALEQAAGVFNINMTCKNEGFEINPSADWITVKGMTSTNGEYVVTFAYEANEGSARTATINFVSGEETIPVEVSQAGSVAAEPTAISSILALELDATIANGTVIEAVVISNTALGNLTSKKGMYVQDATGALQLRLGADHTFAFGDKVKIDLSGAKFGKYNEAIQVSNVANEKVTVLSSGNTVQPKTVSVADFLANRYEGQYVALEGVQVVEADLTKTFVMPGADGNDAHTSINVETVGGESFIVFSSRYASYGKTTVPQGSGTIKGIAARNNDAIQIIFAQESDFAGLTGTRFVAGQEPDPEPEQPAAPTIASILALGNGATIPADTFVEGVVISNKDLSNLTSKKGMYIQDETAGLQFYFAADHSFAFGDKVKVDLSNAKVGAYNGAVQISGLALEKVEVLSSGNTVTPKTVTIADFLANKYEGQYVAIEGVQVADADLSKTFVMGGAHTSINIEDANGKKFVVFSSKYATYGTTAVPQGSGTIKGISSINNGTMQIIFAQASDFAGLTGERFGQGTTEPEPEPEQPGTPVTANRADFETFPEIYGQYTKEFTSAAGWHTVNCAIQEGYTTDINPQFICIGTVPGTDTYAKAVCLNGKTTAVGVLESPEITGGCGVLSFNYGRMFTDNNGVSFKVEVIQSGSTVKTLTFTKDGASVPQKTKLEGSIEVNVSGNFKLKFTNLCPSNSTSNKDRVSIWNLTWTSVQ